MKTLTIKPIYNRKNKLNDRGKALVQIRFTYDRKSLFASTGIYLKPNQWDASRLKLKNHKQKFELNKFLENTEQKSFEYFYRCLNENRPFSLKNLIDYLEGKNSDFIKFFENALVSYDSAKPQTVKLYANCLRLLKEYQNNIPFSSLNYDFITKFERWLKSLEKRDRKGNVRPGEYLSEGYIYNIMNSLKIFTKEAIKNDLLSKNPFDKKKLRRPISKKVYLTIEELTLFEKADKVPRVNDEIRKAFLFQVYTGLRFSDVERLKVKHIKNNWLEIKTKKTGTLVKIPLNLLFETKAAIIANQQRRGKLPESKLFELPRIENYLKHLKLVAKYCGISKNITSHVGRNTCAKLLRNHYQIPLDMLKVILGHSNVEMTGSYAEVTKEGITKAIKEAINKAS